MGDEASYKVIAYAPGTLPKQFEPMIYSKWLRSLRYGNDYFKLIDNDVYFDMYHKYIELLLPKATIHMAVLSDDYDVVLGFSVNRGQVLDYVHVHKDYRRCGIGSLLVPVYINTISHITKQGMSFWNSRLREAKFNPFT